MYESERNAQQLLNFLRPTNPEVAKESPTALEEFACKRGDINMHLLHSRAHRNMRVLDYRIGNYQLKRNMLDRLAKQRGLRKIYTLVEKQDSNSWRTVGFSREAVVPAYFRTADAYVMSRVYDDEGEPLTGGLSKVAVDHEVPEPKNHRKPSSLRLTTYDDPDDMQELVLSDKASSAYAPFGKGIRHPEIAVKGRVGKKEIWLAAETNDSFGHAKIDCLVSPATAKEISAGVQASESLFDQLLEVEMNNCFTFVPVEEEATNQLFASAEFRHTGQLTRHITLDGEETIDMHVWHKRLRPHKP